jgi:hypothetical protein
VSTLARERCSLLDLCEPSGRIAREFAPAQLAKGEATRVGIAE